MMPGHSPIRDDNVARRITPDEIVTAWPEAMLGPLDPDHQQWRGSLPTGILCDHAPTVKATGTNENSSG
jgi:hypothetical protein